MCELSWIVRNLMQGKKILKPEVRSMKYDFDFRYHASIISICLIKFPEIPVSVMYI